MTPSCYASVSGWGACICTNVPHNVLIKVTALSLENEIISRKKELYYLHVHLLLKLIIIIFQIDVNELNRFYYTSFGMLGVELSN